jgi:hypothetical protein
MWAVGLTIGYGVNYMAGVLASILVFGVSEALNLFYYGQIFDLINIGVFLLLLVFCVTRSSNNIGWTLVAVTLLIIFIYFHVNGRYALALILLIVCYEIMRSRISKRLDGKVSEIWNNRFLMPIALLSLVLMVLFAFGVGQPDSPRLMLDASILLAIFAGGVASILIDKRKLLTYGAVALAVFMSIPSVITWCQNNSAVKEVDKEAIAYLNGLNGVTYTSSEQVAQDVYGLFVNKRFETDIFADYAIVRSVPMTPRSNPDNVYFANNDRVKLVDYMNAYGYHLLKEFDCGERDRITKSPIIVDVYGK